MKNNLFITAIGGDIACAALRCICHGYEYNSLIGCDIQEYVQGKKYIDEFIIAPRYNEEAYIEFIKEVCQKFDVTHFLPMTEAEIIIADKNRVFFAENGIKLMINNSKIINIATSKYMTAKFLSQCGINTPETFSYEEYDGQLDYPFIIKANQSCGSKQIKVVTSREEFEQAMKVIKEPVIQRYIGSVDEEYTMGVFADGHTTKSISFKRKLGFGGMSVYVETVKDKAMEQIAEKISKVLELKGSINVQMRRDMDSYSVFEINPRISSTVGFRHQFGFKDVIWWLNMLDKNLVSFEFEIEPGIVGIRVLAEMIFNKT